MEKIHYTFTYNAISISKQIFMCTWHKGDPRSSKTDKTLENNKSECYLYEFQEFL